MMFWVTFCIKVKGNWGMGQCPINLLLPFAFKRYTKKLFLEGASFRTTFHQLHHSMPL
jgi:hypothetical protein